MAKKPERDDIALSLVSHKEERKHDIGLIVSVMIVLFLLFILIA